MRQMDSVHCASRSAVQAAEGTAKAAAAAAAPNGLLCGGGCRWCLLLPRREGAEAAWEASSAPGRHTEAWGSSRSEASRSLLGWMPLARLGLDA